MGTLAWPLVGLAFPLELAGGTLAVTGRMPWRRHGRPSYLAILLAVGCLLVWLLLGAGTSSAQAAHLVPGEGASVAEDPRVTLLSIGYFWVQAALSWAALATCAQASWLEALVLAATGYGIQHVASGILQLVLLALSSLAGNGAAASPASYWACWALTYAATYLLVWGLVGRRLEVDSAKVRGSLARTLLCAGLLFVSIALNLVFADRMAAGLALVACRTYDVLCTSLCVALLVTLSRTDQLSSDLDTVREQRDAQARHHAAEEEDLRRINRIFHDALHEQASQVRREMEGGGSASMPTAHAEDARALGEAVASYDALVQTGEAPLDALLSDVASDLGRQGVQLAAMVDGTAFRFMGEHDAQALWTDLLACLGQAALTAPGAGPRPANVTAGRRGPTVVIDAQCLCGNALPLTDGLPNLPETFQAARSLAILVGRWAGRVQGRVEDGAYLLRVVLVPGSRQP